MKKLFLLILLLSTFIYSQTNNDSAISVQFSTTEQRLTDIEKSNFENQIES